jgi:hypothetical protein
MRALDDILIGFLLFFAIDRTIRLFGNVIIEPVAETQGKTRAQIENIKLAIEVMMLLVCSWLVFTNRKLIGRINQA